MHKSEYEDLDCADTTAMPAQTERSSTEDGLPSRKVATGIEVAEAPEVAANETAIQPDYEKGKAIAKAMAEAEQLFKYGRQLAGEGQQVLPGLLALVEKGDAPISEDRLLRQVVRVLVDDFESSVMLPPARKPDWRESWRIGDLVYVAGFTMEEKGPTVRNGSTGSTAEEEWRNESACDYLVIVCEKGDSLVVAKGTHVDISDSRSGYPAGVDGVRSGCTMLGRRAGWRVEAVPRTSPSR